ncbi:hypothetical protein ZIOFF_028930 [Zingiber officinale]|uniref:Prolyl 4-hydroxylase alpha subunit domain-containing protein n=1 Tax=Zingiber officinale TaxID=94328 RepID=A0A8J5H7E2_ZINOF|nr:hypothetical protein ZIOFF_028930 [Zingiber officinale]
MIACVQLLTLFLLLKQPLHKELYNLHPSAFFMQSFVKAINDNTEESFRNILSEPSPGIYTFSMLQPSFCEMLLDEVDNFEKWVNTIKFKIMRPNTMNKYGAVLDDFGLEAMLNKLMEEFISPMARVFFPEVGGSTLDSHHGFVVEYGKDKDVELGFHVDDSEVTLNVCLGKDFSGGELFFRGVRCDKHVNTETQTEVCHHMGGIGPMKSLTTLMSLVKLYFIVDATDMGLSPQILDTESTCFCGVEGTFIFLQFCPSYSKLKVCKAITLYDPFYSSVFREMRKFQKDFSSWCGECQREKKERQHQSVVAAKMTFLKGYGGANI